MPKGLPRYIATVDGDKFQVKGEETLYEDPCDAVQRARKLGPGHEVIRVSDGKLIALVPNHIPAPPREWM